MQSTEWRPVVGYEGAYEVSDAGQVRSIARRDTRGAYRPGRLLAQSTKERGHLAVSLWWGNRRRLIGVHRLVLEAFTGPCPDGMEACHYDGDAKNNHLSNLRWDTRVANAADTRRLAAHGNTKKATCPRGHLLIGANLYPNQPGRVCVSCGRERVSAYKNGRPFDPERAHLIYARLMPL